MLAHAPVEHHPLGEHFKNIAWGSDSGPIFLGEELARKKDFSEATAELVDQDVRKILDEAYQRTLEVLKKHEAAMHKIAAELLEKETISGERVREILKEARDEGKDSTDAGESA